MDNEALEPAPGPSAQSSAQVQQHTDTSNDSKSHAVKLSSSPTSHQRVPSDPQELANVRFKVNHVKVAMVLNISTELLTLWNNLIAKDDLQATDPLYVNLNGRVNSNLAFVNSIKDRMSESANNTSPPNLEVFDVKPEIATKIGPLYERLRQTFAFGVTFEREVQQAALSRAQQSTKDQPWTLSQPPPNKRSNSLPSSSSNSSSAAPTPALPELVSNTQDSKQANGKKRLSPADEEAEEKDAWTESDGDTPKPNEPAASKRLKATPEVPSFEKDSDPGSKQILSTKPTDGHLPSLAEGQPANATAASMNVAQAMQNGTQSQQIQQAQQPGRPQDQEPARAQPSSGTPSSAAQVPPAVTQQLMPIITQIHQLQQQSNQITNLLRSPQFTNLPPQHQQQIRQQSQVVAAQLEMASQRFRTASAGAGQPGPPQNGLAGTLSAAVGNTGVTASFQTFNTVPPQQAFSPLQTASPQGHGMHTRSASLTDHSLPKSGPFLPGQTVPLSTSSISQTMTPPQRPALIQPQFLPSPFMQQQEPRNAMSPPQLASMPQSVSQPQTGFQGSPAPSSQFAPYPSSISTGAPRQANGTTQAFWQQSAPTHTAPVKPAPLIQAESAKDDIDWSEFLDA